MRTLGAISMLKKLFPHNIKDKIQYSGSEGTAIDILQLTVEKANLSSKNGKEDSHNAKLPLEYEAGFVKSLAKALADSIKYEQYKQLNPVIKQEIKNRIASALLKQANNYKTHQRIDGSSCEKKEGLSLNYTTKEVVCYDGDYGNTFTEKEYHRKSVNFPFELLDVELLTPLIKIALFGNNPEHGAKAFSSILNGLDQDGNQSKNPLLPKDIVQYITFWTIRESSVSDEVALEKSKEIAEDALKRTKKINPQNQVNDLNGGNADSEIQTESSFKC